MASAPCRCLIRRQSVVSRLMANGESVWLAMVGLDAWVYRLLIEAATPGTLALELASLVEQAQDRLNIALNPGCNGDERGQPRPQISKRLDEKAPGRLRRCGPMAVSATLNFRSDEAKAMISAWGMHIDFGPDGAFGRSSRSSSPWPTSTNGMSVVAGGAGGLPRALAAAADRPTPSRPPRIS